MIKLIVSLLFIIIVFVFIDRKLTKIIRRIESRNEALRHELDYLQAKHDQLIRNLTKLYNQLKTLINNGTN